jgi:hypothetical protein
MSSAICGLAHAGLLVLGGLHPVLHVVGLHPGNCTGWASGTGWVPVMPTSWSSASFFTRRSFSAAISWAMTRS